jgi:hypothetical protein
MRTIWLYLHTISNVNFTYSKGTVTLFKLIGKWIGIEGYRLMQGRKGEAGFNSKAGSPLPRRAKPDRWGMKAVNFIIISLTKPIYLFKTYNI